MKKRILAVVLTMILALASVITVSAAQSPSPSKTPHVKDEDENGFYYVEDDQPFYDYDATLKAKIDGYNKGTVKLEELLKDAPDVLKALEGKTDIAGLFDLRAVNGGKPVDGKHEVTVTVPGLSNAKEVVILCYNDTDGWHTLKATVKGEKITAVYGEIDPSTVVAVFGVVEKDNAAGTSPSTGVASSTWMIFVAVAFVAVGAGFVASQKKNR